MLYIDLLDSVQSAFPSEFYPDKQWWRPKNIQQQNQASQLAHAAILLRLLYGETIVLSHNQAFDSVAWLQAAEKLGRENSLSFPPMIWAAHGFTKPRLTAQAFLDKAIETFENPGFKLSAWAGIDQQLRLKIANNLKKYKSFDHMLDNMSSDISDNRVWTWLGGYSTALDSFYSYLKTNRSTFQQKLLIRTSPQVKDYIWPRMELLRDKVDGIPSKILNEIKAKVHDAERQQKKEGLLEIRGALYDAIEEYRENRDEYRKYIDRFYNEKIALSSNKGEGLFSIQDHNPATPPSDDEEKDNLADSANDSNGLISKTSIQFVPDDFPQLGSLSLFDCFGVLKDPDIQASIASLHRNWRNYPKDKGREDLNRQYRNWSERMHEALNRHQEILANKLPGKLKLEDNALVARVGAPFVAATVAAAEGLVTITRYVQVFTPLQIGVHIAAAYATEYLTRWVDKRASASAVGRIRKKLNAATTRNFF